MDINKFTQMAQEAMSKSQLMAGEYGHQQIESGHLLLTLLNQENGVVPTILKKLNLDPSTVSHSVERSLAKKPKVTGPGAGGPTYLSGGLNTVLVQAEKEAAKLRDEYISTEHLFIALADENDEVGKILGDIGVTRQRILEALKEIRGNQRITSQNPEATYQALERYAVDLTERAVSGKLDPVIGRDDEIRRVIQVLSRRTKNNPVLIGEPGVGTVSYTHLTLPTN